MPSWPIRAALAKEDALDFFELNKIAGAILASLFLAVSLNIISAGVFSHPEPVKPGYVIAAAPEASPSGGKAPSAPEASPSGGKAPLAPEAPPSGGKAPSAPEAPPIAERLTAADAKKGEADAKVCQACHNLEKGAGAKIGPPLYGVVGRAKGSAAGFDYSEALKSKGGSWTYADLDSFLADPKAYAPGTKMTFAGESDPAKRASIIAYLRSLSDKLEPLPGK